MERARLIQCRLWVGIALLHLFLVALGAAEISPAPGGPFGPILDAYGHITGSTFNFSFFTPGIFTQLQGHFEVVDNSGHIREVPLASGLNKEADLRTFSVLSQFTALEGQGRPEKELLSYRRSVSASLARLFFHRYPGTRRVVVRLDSYEPLSRGEFVLGSKPFVSLFYKAEYSLNPRQAQR